MVFKYQKQYRLPGHNYASTGYYFITICTHNRECNKSNRDFHWQPRFHDHIIRTEKSLKNIRQYIKYNHLHWKQDIFYNP